MKNVVFDLGGVVFGRDRRMCEAGILDFFSFLRQEPQPRFWSDYDRGTASFEATVEALARLKGCSPAECGALMRRAISLQRPVGATERLIGELKAAGYRLYVLSNMSEEFIAFLRRFPVYAHFDGEVISCEEGAVKPEPRIYAILMERYGLDPARTIFIDDRAANIEAARRAGIEGFLFDAHRPGLSCHRLRRMLLAREGSEA